MHGQSYLAGGIYLLCRQRSPVAWGRASDNTAQGARSDSGLLPLGKVPESGAGGGHASLEDWVRCYRNSNNRAVRMAHSVLERVQPSPRHAESFQGAPRRIPASLKVCFSPKTQLAIKLSVKPSHVLNEQLGLSTPLSSGFSMSKFGRLGG